MSAVERQSWPEEILRLAAGESAPAGCVLKQVLGSYDRQRGPILETVYVVEVRRERDPSS